MSKKGGYFMDISIEKLNEIRKQKKISYDELAKLTGYSRSTITNIFCGYVDFPRHETMQAIERALGIEEEKTAPEYTDAERQLFELIKQLTDEETEELSNFVDFILSKRK
jgi:transcriptional regulator with XRE-family HTH domain